MLTKEIDQMSRKMVKMKKYITPTKKYSTENKKKVKLHLYKKVDLPLIINILYI